MLHLIINAFRREGEREWGREDAQKFKNKPPPPDEVFHFALLVKLNTFFTFLY